MTLRGPCTGNRGRDKYWRCLIFAGGWAGLHSGLRWWTVCLWVRSKFVQWESHQFLFSTISTYSYMWFTVLSSAQKDDRALWRLPAAPCFTHSDMGDCPLKNNDSISCVNRSLCPGNKDLKGRSQVIWSQSYQDVRRDGSRKHLRRLTVNLLYTLTLK